MDGPCGLVGVGHDSNHEWVQGYQLGVAYSKGCQLEYEETWSWVRPWSPSSDRLKLDSE